MYKHRTFSQKTWEPVPCENKTLTNFIEKLIFNYLPKLLLTNVTLA